MQRSDRERKKERKRPKDWINLHDKSEWEKLRFRPARHLIVTSGLKNRAQTIAELVA